MKKVAIIMGSDSDLEVVSDAAKILEEFNVGYEMTVSSAHRSPKRTKEFVESCHKNGIKVIIASAGLAAHLAGTIAAHFPLPVIGIPIKNGELKGIDALFSTVQMPPGVPVAAVGINSAKNAGLLAIQILAVSDKNLEGKLVEYKNKLAEEVEEKGEKLEKEGWEKYLQDK